MKFIFPQSGDADSDSRQKIVGHNALTVWLTGLSGSGKSTLAYCIEKQLINEGMLCSVIDGDNIRSGLNKDLGFGKLDRTENIRRVAEVAKMMNDAGLIVITSLISPYLNDRMLAKKIIGEDRFLEVYLNTPLSVCESRDPKGLYIRARSGEIPFFTGVSAPYEPPKNPSMILDTSTEDIERIANRIKLSIFIKTTVILPPVKGS